MPTDVLPVEIVVPDPVPPAPGDDPLVVVPPHAAAPMSTTAPMISLFIANLQRLGQTSLASCTWSRYSRGPELRILEACAAASRRFEAPSRLPATPTPTPPHCNSCAR